MLPNLAISNIAWNKDEDNSVYELMQKYSCIGLEIAPTRTWTNIDNFSLDSAKAFKKIINARSIEIVAMQSLMFNYPELTFFETFEKNKNSTKFLKCIIDLASYIGNLSLVFGSPKNRLIGNMKRSIAEEIAINTFGAIGDYAFSKNVYFCLEPNPTVYGADFLTTTNEAVNFIKKVNSPGLWVNIDTGTIAINHEPVIETLNRALPYAKHIHISEPLLTEIKEIDFHSTIVQQVIKNGYKGWVSIEMKSGLNPSNISTVSNVLNLVQSL